ncbi:vacuolar calcium ion transporter [Aspergillus homomorphus CBS 101889]|uniref:Vacuolar calcium ion transporter n=1 Tax=Aspergillus homomorphus (strain CBS 101889) TaxID=1450537 RepID=A0A395HHU2_ASPHC|nr:vacuolar calcium ion transporter [Aspergillus homomorphus CBS 101889]RAL07377.1 vacuolar calcium ion transporter [Aspergillus homomorphus CBS 101889]
MASTVGFQSQIEDQLHPLLKNDSASGSESDAAHPLNHNQKTTRSLFSTTARSGAYLPICFLPLAITAGYMQWNPVLVFVYNFFAIVALSALISDSSDQLSNHAGDLGGAVIDTVPRKAVILSLGAWAVASREIYVAQSMVIGGILSDILLIFGSSLIAASRKTNILYFPKPLTSALSPLMLVTATVLILPSVLNVTFPYELGDRTVSFSRGTSIILLCVYAGYLYFQLGTHRHLFRREQADAHCTAASSPIPALLTLFLSTLATIPCTRYLADTLVITAARTGLSKTFLAATLVPLACTAASGMTLARACARSEDVDAAIRASVQHVVHVGLFAMPVLVVLGWVLGKPMTLVFDEFETAVLFFAVFLVNGLLHGGKYSVVHGLALVALYAILTLAFCVR